MNTKDKIVFVSSPYFDDDPYTRENNFALVSLYIAELNKKSVIAFSPVTYSHTLLNFKEEPIDLELWLSLSKAFIEKSVEMVVYKIPGWNKDKMVSKEIKIAKELGLSITYKKTTI